RSGLRPPLGLNAPKLADLMNSTPTVAINPGATNFRAVVTTCTAAKLRSPARFTAAGIHSPPPRPAAGSPRTDHGVDYGLAGREGHAPAETVASAAFADVWPRSKGVPKVSTRALENRVAPVTTPIWSDDDQSCADLDRFMRARPRMFAIAHRIIGNVHEA